ncbi:unnamed protein product [Nezara viridula]|uniref:Uncharacterized protein n=1 Tax=Nezara viridula TaxID=85310 RepID=A0A9P0E2K3_NEZVI|nr:unnamed protein product [Nezara viridula]
MNQLNMFLCFVLLYLSLLGGVGCCSNKNISHLNRTLSYSFEGFSCVQMFSPDDLPWQYYKVLPALGVPVVINQSNKYCYGFVLFAIDTIHLKKMLINIKKYYNHRIVCYLQYEDSLLNSFVKNETYLFGESEALITDGYRTYKFDELEKIFYEINLIGEEETWGKQRRIMNFKGREVTVAGFNVSMFTSFGQVDEKGHPAWFKGIDLYVLWRLTSLMNITWKALISKDRWGMKLPNGTWTPGVFRAVLDGKADIGVGSIWMTIEKYESMPLTAPTSMVYLRHLIRRPAASNAIWNSFFKHYPPSVWALLLVAAFINVLAISLITYCINRIRNDIAHKSNFLMLNHGNFEF